jgi:hypothetical protein
VNTFQSQSIGITLSLLGVCCLKMPTIANELRLVSTISQPSLAATKFPDRVIASKKIVGYFQYFSWGDYFYAVVKTSRGKKILFMLNPPSQQLLKSGTDCFLASHQHQRLRIEYDTIDSYIPQAGGYHSIETIKNIRTERTTLDTWRTSMSRTRLKQCGRLIERATKSH